MPAFAAAHKDTSQMLCAEYNDLPLQEQKVVAMAAITELSTDYEGTVAPNDGTARATEAPKHEDGKESPAGSTNTIADSNGTATATSTVGAGSTKTNYEEHVELLNLTCERSIEATVQEAASGMEGTR